MYKVIKPVFVPANPDYPTRNSRWIDGKTGLRKNFDGTLERPKFMKQNHKGALTRDQKKVATKIMYEAGWGSKRLAQWFKVTTVSVRDWAKIPTPDSLKEFEQRFKAAMVDYDMESTWNIKSRINQLIPTENDMTKLVKAGEYFSNEKDRRVSQNNTQVNVYQDMIKKYSEEGQK